MTPHYEDAGVTLHHGDCLDVLRDLADASVDAVVTDPPYGISFMGKQWDQPGEFGSLRKNGQPAVHAREAGRDRASVGDTGAMDAGRYDLSPHAMHNFQRWVEAWATECMRILKPGGHMLAFGGARTWHRLAGGIEDAGFEIRDSIAWLFGSGFPKSMDVAKAIASGTGRPEDIRRMAMGDDYVPSGRGRVNYDHGSASAMNGSKSDVDVPDHAAEWLGWGTALKPAFEPVIVARKPLAGTVAANVLAHGTGALHIDACRIGDEGGTSGAGPGPRGDIYDQRENSPDAGLNGSFGVRVAGLGRWPANVVLDASQAAVLDEQAPETGGAGRASGPTLRGETDATVAYGARKGWDGDPAFYGDTGGASRFFYVAKAGSDERPRVDGVAHPTVKPLDLMRWLVRLVTPPGGTVLEPFAGSGTTVEACLLEGFRVVAIEREAEYLPLIESRIARRRDPVRAIELAGEDAGLFGLLEGETA